MKFEKMKKKFIGGWGLWPDKDINEEFVAELDHLLDRARQEERMRIIKAVGSLRPETALSLKGGFPERIRHNERIKVINEALQAIHELKPEDNENST